MSTSPSPGAGAASSSNPRTEAIRAARSHLIVALDTPDLASALTLVDRLEQSCSWFKVGLELFTAAGPKAVEALTSRGFNVFLDLKLHDIPNTVAGAVRSAASLGARLLTVHAAGGPAMLAAARDAAAGLSNPPKLLAVTVLTSMDAAQLTAIGVAAPPAQQVERLARMGLDAGIRGLVCSPEEVATLRGLTGRDGTLVIPGIRPAGATLGDQKRVATAAEALRRGASYLVVGRPITQSSSPAEAARQVLDEMAAVLGG